MVGLVYAGAVVPYLQQRSNHPGAVVAELRAAHGSCDRLVSFGPVWHQFAYHFRAPIELRPWPKAGDDVAHIDYFCFDTWGPPPKLPFAWEKVAVVPGARFHTRPQHFCVIVGRRLPNVAVDPAPARRPRAARQRDLTSRAQETSGVQAAANQ
jgi:hypothetical protein